MHTPRRERIDPGSIDLDSPYQPDCDAEFLVAVRRGRLQRLQHAMRSLGVAGCLFFAPANIRYATGTDVMGVWSATTFARHCLVPAEGDPILFEYPGSMHVSRQLVRDVRPAAEWQFQVPSAEPRARAWAREIRGTMAKLGIAGDPLALDRLDAPGFLALGAEGVRVIEAGPVTRTARVVKTPEELEVVRRNGTVGEQMLAELQTSVHPGVREYELLATLSWALLRRHGEVLSTRLLSSGRRTNPWMQEANARLVAAGDMVAVDTDAHGYEGYVIDISRGFLCGDRPTPEQRDSYQAAHEVVVGLVESVRPGMTYWELANAAPKLPARYQAQRYPSLGHHAGLEVEGPDIPHPDDRDAWTPELRRQTIEPGMVLSLQCYAGIEGGGAGVKLEDQVIVTGDGCALMCRYPYDDRLLR